MKNPKTKRGPNVTLGHCSFCSQRSSSPFPSGHKRISIPFSHGTMMLSVYFWRMNLKCKLKIVASRFSGCSVIAHNLTFLDWRHNHTLRKRNIKLCSVQRFLRKTKEMLRKMVIISIKSVCLTVHL